MQRAIVLKLYGNALSTNTARVRTVLEELSLPYELVDVDRAKGEQKAPAFTAVQPFGRVPYLEDGNGGFKLFESRAICRYLALKYGGVGLKLIPDPADLEKTALFEQGASIELSSFEPFAAPLVFENLVKPRVLGIETDKAYVEKLKGLLEAKLSGYEALLGRQKYLGGNDVTLVDLFHLPCGSFFKILKIDFFESDKYPNIKKWWADISSRPSWQKVSAR